MPNSAADVAKEVLDYLVGEHGYGNKDSRTGKALENRFGGIGYGWDRDMLRLILAVLFRAGSIEVNHGGQKFDTYTDPRCRVPFTNNTAFKSALFTPVKPIDLKTLKRAVESYEELTGATVSMDKIAIATALKKVADDESKLLIPVEAVAKANRLPVVAAIADYLTTLTSIQNGSADDCVKILAGEGKSLKDAHDRMRKVRDALDEAGLAVVRLARTALNDCWGQLETRGQIDLQPQADELKSFLGSEAFYESMSALKSSAQAIAGAYRELYGENHARRANEFATAIEAIKGRPEWAVLPKEMQEPLLQPLAVRACARLDLIDGGLVCRNCRATLSQMESDLAAMEGLKSHAFAQMVKLTTPPDTKLVQVRLSEFFNTLDNEDAIRQAVDRLRDHLLKLLDEGVKIVVE